MLPFLLLVMLGFSGRGPALRFPPGSSPGRQVAAARSVRRLAAVSGLNATPGTISFHASNPDGGVVAGNSIASLNWTADGISTQNWTLSVQAGSTTFEGCSTIPVSAVTVTCNSGSVSNGGTTTCAGAFALSSSLQQVAAGTEGDGASSYTVNLSFTLAESWRYIATQSSCPLTLTYLVDAQ